VAACGNRGADIGADSPQIAILNTGVAEPTRLESRRPRRPPVPVEGSRRHWGQDLGSLHDGTDPCSFANSSNTGGQIVGQSISDCDTDSRALLWENGGPMVDLNSLIPPGSDFVLEEPQYINERGEIAGLARLPDGSSREFLLIPNGDRGDAIGAAEAMESDMAAAPGSTTVRHGTLTPQKLAALQARLAKRHRVSGSGRPK
jgi:probable HAF family extracellular repeat protein